MMLESIERQGNFLFRWRSYVPLPLFAVLIVWVYANSSGTVIPQKHWLWTVACVVVGGLGLAVRAWVGGQVPDGTSGRNTRHQAASTLNTSGPYSVVRHPLYLGNYCMWLGVALFTGSIALVALTTTYFALVYERIMAAEERYLLGQFGDSFTRWASSTPAIIPRLKLWQASALPFSWRSVARKEYSAMFGFIVAIAVLQTLADSLRHGSLALDPPWRLVLALGTGTYLILRLLKRHTHVLHVGGR